MSQVAPARQGIYKQSIIDKTCELFGDTSVEYGMALCGALELEPHLQRYSRNFTAEELLKAIKVEDGIDDGAELIDEAKWQIQIGELRKLINDYVGASTKPAAWFTPPK